MTVFGHPPRWWVSWCFMGIATIAIVVGYVKLDVNQDAIADTGRRADRAICEAFGEMRESLVAIIEFSTQPADLTGLDATRRAVVEDLNERRVVAREQVLALLPQARRCRSR